VATEYGRALLYAGQHDAAATQLRRAIQLDPGRNLPYALMRSALTLQGRHADAATVLAEAVDRGAHLSGVPTVGGPCLAAASGRDAEAQVLLAQFTRTGRAAGAPPRAAPTLPDPTDEDLAVARSWADTRPSRTLARVYACLGDEARTLEYLERALAQREPGLPEILSDPEIPWLRVDERFAHLRKRLNLPS
jgi:tetratricopeptide (TPR) repeat protein